MLDLSNTQLLAKQRQRQAPELPVPLDGYPGDRALVDRLELHRRLVGLDLGEDVAGGDAVAFLDQPFGQRALLHGGGRERAS